MFAPSDDHPLPWDKRGAGDAWSIRAANGRMVAALPPAKGAGRTAAFIVALANREPDLIREVAGRIMRQ